MTSIGTRSHAASTPTPRTLSRAGATALLALAAPAVSFLPALTTNVHGSGAAVTFPHGYPVMLAVTIAGAVLAHHAHLLGWGIALMAAVVVGAAAGLPLAARR